MMQKHSKLLVLFACFAGIACGPPKGRIAESSKTDECKADIVGALQAFKRDLGLDFDVSDADADAVFAEGHVGKSYARDGSRHEARFGLDLVDDDGCSMRFYQRTVREPGSRTTNRGNFGSVNLNVCKCE